MSDKLDASESTNGFAKQSEDYFARMDTSRLLSIHFVICSAGLMVVSMFITGLLAKTIHLPEHLVTNLYPWAQQTAGVRKITSLLQYVVPVVVMFAYYPITLFLSKSFLASQNAFHRERFPTMWLFYLALIVINAGLLLANKEKTALMGLLSFMWVLLFLWFPLSVFLNRRLAAPRWLTCRIKWFLGLVVCLISAHYASVFIPLIADQMIIGQDYVNITERTILNNGKVVDNLDYINSHQIKGLQLYDPRKSTVGTVLKVEDCQERYQALKSFERIPGEKFNCDSKTGSLIVKTPFVSLKDNNFRGFLEELPVSAEEEDFIRLNTEGNLERQVLRGWFLFHHGYSFGPMNALSLGASPENQTMVYGWLSTVTQGKILESLGMMSYQGYFKAYFSIYIVYFVVFLLGIWLIYKNLGTVVFAGVLAVSAILVLGIELIKLAPGFNPVRHFFDVPAFYLLYRYLSDKRKTYLFAATTLSLFAVLWSKDLGLFLATSVGGALIVHSIGQRPFHRLPLIAGAITAATGMLLYLYPMPGANPTSLYMFLGVGAPLATSKEIFNLILMVGLLLLATLWIKQNSTYRILTLGMAFYFVQSLTYYVWYPELHHLWGVAPVFILWMVALYHGWLSQYQDAGRITKRKLLGTATVMLLIYFPASVHFAIERKEYLQQFENHQLYQWAFEKGTFASTMDPSLFEDAVKLIKQYSPDNGIYIISKYDHVLPILAGKFSAMPYNELLTNMVSSREAVVAAGAILENKPKYLFVDSDIGNGYVSGAPQTGTANSTAERAALHLQNFYSEAVSREKLLGGLNDVFLMVADKYKKCKMGGLVSVYCRKSN